MRPVAAIVFLLTVAAPLAAQSPAPGQTSPDSLIAKLTSEKFEDRAEAVQAALAMPEGARTPVLQQALETEFMRYVKETVATRKPEPGGRQGGRSESRGREPEKPKEKGKDKKGVDPKVLAEADYLADLIAAVSKSGNTNIVPSLIQVADMGQMVTDALARFGEVAVPQVVDAARGQVRDSVRTGLLMALRTVAESTAPVSATDRTGIVKLALDVLEPASRRPNQNQKAEQGERRAISMSPDSRGFNAALAVEIGVALGSPEVRKIAEAIVKDENEAIRRAGSDIAAGMLVQKAKDALEHHPEKNEKK
jgi:hypothetical protein